MSNGRHTRGPGAGPSAVPSAAVLRRQPRARAPPAGSYVHAVKDEDHRDGPSSSHVYDEPVVRPADASELAIREQGRQSIDQQGGFVGLLGFVWVDSAGPCRRTPGGGPDSPGTRAAVTCTRAVRPTRAVKAGRRPPAGAALTARSAGAATMDEEARQGFLLAGRLRTPRPTRLAKGSGRRAGPTTWRRSPRKPEENRFCSASWDGPPTRSPPTTTW